MTPPEKQKPSWWSWRVLPRRQPSYRWSTLNARMTLMLRTELRQRFLRAGKAEICLADLLLGEELAAQVYGPLPPDWEPTCTRVGKHRG